MGIFTGTTVDGEEKSLKSGINSPVDMVNIPLFIGFQHHPRWLFGISEPSTVVQYTNTLQGTDTYPTLGKGKHRLKNDLEGDMLHPRSLTASLQRDAWKTIRLPIGFR